MQVLALLIIIIEKALSLGAPKKTFIGAHPLMVVLADRFA
jgi:hypothetical protein